MHSLIRFIPAAIVAALWFTAPIHARVVGRVHAFAPAGQATVKIEVTGGPIIYIDPTGFTTSPADADIILLTHNHGDHQSVAVINRVRKANTVLVSSPPGVPALMTNFAGTTIHAVTPGQKLTLGGVEIETVPMYNVVKNNHPRALNYVGYVVNVGGVRVYHGGDTERFPEMKTFTADVAMLPLGQTFTMNSVQEAADAALDVRARIAIPIHWGLAEGTLADANQFATLLRDRMDVFVTTGPNGVPLEISETIAIAEHPASQTLAPGAAAALSVQASGTGALRYQWRRNGVALVGATAATLPIARAAADNAGDYEVIVTDANGPQRSRMARLAVEAPQPGRLVNLSVRAAARGPGAPLIVGAVVAGGSKSVLVRGIGPGLAGFGVTGTVIDPRLDIHGVVNGRDTIVASNNDWGAGGAAAALRTTFAAVGAFDLADTTSRDAALVTTLDNARTVHVSDATERTGVALVELYDADPTSPSRLVNLSARNFAGTGDGTLIAGFVISGNVPKRLLIRGVGPRLAAGFGVTGALADPKVELYLSEGGRSTLFAANDNWAEVGAAPVRAAFVAAGAFDLPDAASRDAAMVVTVPAGAYTAQLSGVGNATGEALIEIYELP
ncbi:MBL fold metallo-hydrolase [Horticoccus sp. 23ND18S-11]|uniref:MBL fold metallo-hydrolase n=1 Tax=Horticoccus sp. 23ND18S-11 TaxID=3391832 RepID=UPI0039C90E41